MYRNKIKMRRFTSHLKFESINASKQRLLNVGFTLIEILIAMAIVSGIVFVVSIFTLDVSQFQLFLGQSLQTEGQAQNGLQGMIPEIRAIGSASDGGYPISQASSSSFTFFSDIDNDGLFEQVRYFLSGSILKKGVVKPSQSPYIYDQSTEKISDVVQDIVSSNIFSYFDKNYDGTNGSSLGIPINVSAIRVVRVDLKIDNDVNREPGPQTYSVVLEIRNLRGL